SLLISGGTATLEGSGVLIAHTGSPDKKFAATFRVGVTDGGPGRGTLQLTVLAPAFSALPIALPTENVLVGQISVGESRTTEKGGEMRTRVKRIIGLGGVVVLGGVLLLLTTFAVAASGQAQHVRWDIISTIGVPGAVINPGGHASADAANGGDTITLTGSGTFVAPATGGGSGAATGGGTWTTTSGGSGTYVVTRL